MLGFLFRRLLVILPTLALLVVVCFFLMRLAPGGPFTSEKPLPPAVMKNVTERYGLNEPLGVQLYTYVKNIVLHFDFGPSFRFKDRTVNDIIKQGFPVTLIYGFWSAVLVVMTGIPLGIIAALRHNSWADYITTGMAVFVHILPNFVQAPLMVLCFTLWLHWLPGGGWEGGQARFIIMPAIALGTAYLAGVARFTRGSMIEVLNSAYIRTARAKGLSEFRIIWGHALKPALIPVISYLSPVISYMLCGSVFIDVFFTTGGIGQEFIAASYNRDYSVLLGLTIVYGLIVFLMNLLVDLLFIWIDPKMAKDM